MGFGWREAAGPYVVRGRYAKQKKRAASLESFCVGRTETEINSIQLVRRIEDEEVMKVLCTQPVLYIPE